MTVAAPLSHLGEALKSGKPVMSAWSSFAEPMLAETMVREGYDTVVLDMQHGAHDIASVQRGITHVTLAGKPCIVRIPVGDFATVSRLYDFGAAAVIAPMINNLADARAFAAFAKYPPLGDRSWGPARALTMTGMPQPDYLKTANGLQLAIAMIETREALDAIDDILGVAGIDGVFVGPSDLSIALSKGDHVSPDSPVLDEALRHIVARVRAHNKTAGIYTFSGAKAAAMVKQGFNWCTVCNDSLLLRLGARAELKAARQS
ncbi:MAG: hydroxyacid aldolase [Hyphomicrobiales bacterium]|nr:hydroxyacid aldolase [Hyphomicrobiales bacterium]